MPLQLTVSRNRKTSHNYNSEGHGISVTVELDQALLQHPADLQDQIQRLYAEADAALDRQSSSPGNASGSATEQSNGNHGEVETPRGMTDSQRRAIEAIGRKLQVDPEQECRHEFGRNLDDLSVREASRLIDHLKEHPRNQTPSNGRHGRTHQTSRGAGGRR